MGTGRPQVEITAATLAGGDKNQDRYAYGDGWAFVLDGASSFAKTQPEHDGGWYAEQLKESLVWELTANPNDKTPDIVARAIRTASSAHEDSESCPTSTISLARWSPKTVEVYVLGDSTSVLIGDDQEEVLTDTRLADMAPSIRAEYRSRLAAGTGFDDRHRQLLQELQAAQALARNQPHGYWIAGAEPEAAHHAATIKRPLSDHMTLVLLTDGAAAGIRYGVFHTWIETAGQAPHEVLAAVREVEESDERGVKWPRSKLSDDKTLVVVNFGSRP